MAKKDIFFSSSLLHSLSHLAPCCSWRWQEENFHVDDDDDGRLKIIIIVCPSVSLSVPLSAAFECKKQNVNEDMIGEGVHSTQYSVTWLMRNSHTLSYYMPYRKRAKVPIANPLLWKLPRSKIKNLESITCIIHSSHSYSSCDSWSSSSSSSLLSCATTLNFMATWSDRILARGSIGACCYLFSLCLRQDDSLWIIKYLRRTTLFSLV